jgi:hypothetical protein
MSPMGRPEGESTPQRVSAEVSPVSHAAFRGTGHAAIVAVTLLAAGCQLGPRPVTDDWAQPRGEWQVVSHRAPGIAAMSPADAQRHVGSTVRFGPGAVTSGADTCARPTFVVNLVYAERYLYRHYGLHTRDLGLYRHQDVRVTEVFCEGRKWPGLGAHAIWVDAERGYAVRDGVWFELRRAAPTG